MNLKIFHLEALPSARLALRGLKALTFSRVLGYGAFIEAAGSIFGLTGPSVFTAR
jgi:hypothetical protein